MKRSAEGGKRRPSPAPLERVLESASAPISDLACFASVAPGLESHALAEAIALGLDARPEEGGFGWTGDVSSVMLANVGLRIASASRCATASEW